MDTIETLRSALLSGESKTIEFMRVCEPRRLAETISAFANTQGGTIFIGVEEPLREGSHGLGAGADRSVVGVAPESVHRFVHDLRRYFDEPLPDVNTEDITSFSPNLTVVAVHVRKHGPGPDIALKDLSIWRRKGFENKSDMTRARPIRSTTSEPEVQDSLAISDNLNINVIRSATQESPGDKDNQRTSLPSIGIIPPTDANRQTSEPTPNPSPEPTPGPSPDRSPTSSSEQALSPSPEPTPAPSPTPEPSTSPERSIEADLSASAQSGEQAEGAPPAASSDPSNKPTPKTVGNAFDLRRDSSEREKSLSVDAFADAIAAYFNAVNENLCFGLFGHWGRGKTFLMNEVSARLKDRSYSSVSISAWQYRTTPELWANLYETVAREARKACWLVTPRTGLAQYGIWPIIAAFLGFGVSLIGWSDKFKWALLGLQAFGICGVVYLISTLVSVRRLGTKLQRKYTTLTSHREKLGLQAAIGDDLRSLVIGWIPDDFWLPHSSDWTVQGICHWLRRHIVAIACYGLAVAFVAYELYPPPPPPPREDHHITLENIRVPFYGTIPIKAPSWLPTTIFLAWIAGAVVGPLVALKLSVGTRRLLLVIDDLVLQR